MKKVALIVAGLGMIVLFSSGNTSAQVIGVTGAGSSEFGFDPANLIDAVTGVGVGDNAGKCFICVNTSPGAGGTTAGALTNSMFGVIRKNSEADLGEDSSRPEDQDPSIPTMSGSCGTDCNDAGSFKFSMPLPDLDFLSQGTVVASTNPDLGSGVVVGSSGVKMSFSNDFEYFDGSDGINAAGSSTFDQTVSQTTATGGFIGNEVQVVEFSANSANPPKPTLGGSGGRIFWSQSIEEGGFNLGRLEGSFIYNVGNFEKSSAPTGAGQSVGASGQEIGTVDP